MAVAQKVDLSMMRGDTLSFDIVLNDIDQSSIVSLYFTVRKKATDETIILQKSLGNGIDAVEGDDIRYRVRIAPEDTEAISISHGEIRFEYDVEIGIENDIYTPIKGQLTIVKDVTY